MLRTVISLLRRMDTILIYIKSNSVKLMDHIFIYIKLLIV